MHNDTTFNSPFWDGQALKLPWFKPFSKSLDWIAPSAHWFPDGELNASYICLDAHLKANRSSHTALIWESENGQSKKMTYQELYQEVQSFSFVLQSLGVLKGDRVIIYMPMIPETLCAMLACARLGALHSVVFSGFSSHALKDRIEDTQAHYVITADYSLRRGKTVHLKSIAREAIASLPFIKKLLVIERDDKKTQPLHESVPDEREVSYNVVKPSCNVYVPPVPVESNHPLFILYTSGTTDRPKGIVHSTGGYLTYIYATFSWAFNPNPQSIYWCTADVGWITGHSYVAYAPLMHGLTVFIFEGAPDFPDAGIWWKLIDKYKISIFYTSPTALRMAMKAGNSWPLMYDLSSLAILGSVGEPINPDVWQWYSSIIGGNRVPVIDTWWQTETGGFMIAPTADLHPKKLKPGSAYMALPTIEAVVVDEQGQEITPGTKGFLVIKKPWPGMALGIWGDQQRFEKIYWSKFPGMYYSGDYAVKDEDGCFWLLGRADEVLSISGHRIGTAEIEHAAISHAAVAEAAAIGIHDALRGEAVVIFVTLKAGTPSLTNIEQEIIIKVRENIGAFVTPKQVHLVTNLPKTRSGKIMRRVLKGLYEGKTLGDITTLEDEASVEEITKIYHTMQITIQPTLD